MTQPPPERAVPPGWYPDPAGASAVRWWNGVAWTEYLSQNTANVPRPQPRPQLDPKTPVYGVLIWLLVLLPVVVYVLELTWNPDFRFTYSTIDGQVIPQVDFASIFTLSYFLLALASWALYAGSVVLAYFDWRGLQRVGVVRPFHWAWSFLFSGVYVIGRSVIVHRVAKPRGLVPLWVWIGVAVAGVVVGIVLSLDIASGILSSLTALPPNS